MWWEVPDEEFGGTSESLIWIKYLKGGDYRRWYGNLIFLLHYNQNREYILQQKNARVLDLEFLNKRKCTWTDLTSGTASFRYAPEDTFYDISGHCFFPSEEDQLYLLGYANTSFVGMMKKVFNSSFHFQVGDLAKIVVPNVSSDQKAYISSISEKCVDLSRKDWDSIETSWDFTELPLVQKAANNNLHQAYKQWKHECNDRFYQLKANEEELNRIFAEIYGMEDEVPIVVPLDKVSVHYVVDTMDELPEDWGNTSYVRTKRDEVVSLISYAISCMVGRYSLDKPGLILANQGDGLKEYLETVPNPTFHPDEDGIIPFTDVEYFHDDATGLFVNFMRTAFGEANLEQNLQFVADSLGGSGTSRQVIREYFRNDFFADHCKIYSVQSAGKRPIYWLFDSGKKGGFRALFYMHRYTPDLLARLRTEYVHPQQERYRTQIAHIDDAIATADKREQVALKKQRKKLSEQLAEITSYEEKLHHLADQMIKIDLDDGVKHNYALFQDVLAKIK